MKDFSDSFCNITWGNQFEPEQDRRKAPIMYLFSSFILKAKWIEWSYSLSVGWSAFSWNMFRMCKLWRPGRDCAVLSDPSLFSYKMSIPFVGWCLFLPEYLMPQKLYSLVGNQYGGKFYWFKHPRGKGVIYERQSSKSPKLTPIWRVFLSYFPALTSHWLLCINIRPSQMAILFSSV